MMDVLIFPGYGIGHYPSFLFDNKDEIPMFPKNRTGKIIEKIRNAAVLIDYTTTKDLIEYLKNHKNAIVQSKDQDDMFYAWNEAVHWLETMEIISVDNSTPWTIDEYDGSECICYPKIKIKDENMNYCEIS